MTPAAAAASLLEVVNVTSPGGDESGSPLTARVLPRPVRWRSRRTDGTSFVIGDEVTASTTTAGPR